MEPSFARVLSAATLLSLATASCGGQDSPSAAAAPDSGPDDAGPPPLVATPPPEWMAPTPDPDAFYAAPDPLPDVEPGTILESREVTFARGGVPLPNAAWQLRFMSRDARGAPQIGIATVVLPAAPAPGTPLVSYQFAENSLGNHCAPSHQVTGGTENANTALELSLLLPAMEQQGWTVVFPDHEGPYSAYAAGPLAGHVVLDAIRAAERFEPLGLSGERNPVGLFGYSGGGLATAWAAQLQPTYAPELDVVGIASGGTPVSPLGATRAFDRGGTGNAFFFLGFSAIVGVARAFPELLPEAIMNDQGLAAVASVKDGCVGATTDGSPPPSGGYADFVTVPDPFDTPAVRENRAAITLPQAGQRPAPEWFLYHSIDDQLIPVADVDAAVAEYCDGGSRIHYQRVAGTEHIGLAATGAAPAVSFLQSRFEGADALLPVGTVTCN